MPPQTTSLSKPGFRPAVRVHRALTAPLEQRLLQGMARRAPAWLSSDGLTVLGCLGQLGAGASYLLARHHRYGLLLVDACLVVNWLGDSLDGTLARVRRQQRPRYGFYVDHIIDVFGAVILVGGLGFSGLLHPGVAAAVLVGFLVLAGESYLATYSLARFELSQGLFGPTEIRLLLILGNLAALRSPYSTVLGHRWLLFDLGGTVAALAMGALALWLAAHHTAELRREEPLP